MLSFQLKYTVSIFASMYMQLQTLFTSHRDEEEDEEDGDIAGNFFPPLDNTHVHSVMGQYLLPDHVCSTELRAADAAKFPAAL